jgi:ABC-type polysaccharide/polyol phosphate transport system ATPase subunit
LGNIVRLTDALVDDLCDRACLLLNGRIVAEGLPAQVIDKYREAIGTAEGPLPA